MRSIYIIGIGGIGMSGIARILRSQGYVVQGSDAKESSITKELQQTGIKVFIGHKAENIANADVVIRSTAIKDNNCEVIAAQNNQQTLLSRAEILDIIVKKYKRAIAITGCHGKTTTTALMGHILYTAGYDPTIINGGIMNEYNSNVRIGDKDWLVFEADESDKTFMHIAVTHYTIITNVDFDHLDCYGSEQKLLHAFVQYMHRALANGVLAINFDDQHSQECLQKIADIQSSNTTQSHEYSQYNSVISYGINFSHAQVRATKIYPTKCDFVISNEKHWTIRDCKLAIPGIHNVYNMLAAVSIAIKIGISPEDIQRALQSFSGVSRRFTFLTRNAQNVIFLDDYAHHPHEITATIKAARSVYTGRVVIVVQPHRFTRLQALFPEYITALQYADHVILTAVYSAGEEFCKKYNSNSLYEEVLAKGFKNITLVEELNELNSVITQIIRANDVVIFMGAGNISQWARKTYRVNNTY